MNTHLKIIALIITPPSVLITVSSCSKDRKDSPSGKGDPGGKLVITGSSTTASLVSEIGKMFQSEHPGVRIDHRTGGSSKPLSIASYL